VISLLEMTTDFGLFVMMTLDMQLVEKLWKQHLAGEQVCMSLPPVFNVPYRHTSFFLCIVCCDEPSYMIESLLMEREIRKSWWDVKEGDVVMDVGAGYGVYTLAALALGASLAIALEPGKTEFFDLFTNLLVNGWISRALPLNVLAVDNSRFDDYFWPASHSCVREQGSRERRVCMTVDQVVKEAKIDRLDWMKVDVEGTEHQVLQGSVEALEKFHPKLIIENHIGFFPNVTEEVQRLLKPLGYQEEQLVKPGVNENWSLWQVLDVPY